MDIVQVIQAVGVPVAFCIAMGWYVKYITDQHREDRKAADQRHKDEIHDVTQALNNNTAAIQKLTDYIMFGDGSLRKND